MGLHNSVPKYPRNEGSVTKLLYSPDNKDQVMLAAGVTVPTDADTGYATGCIFVHTDGGNGTALYVNEGTSSSCDFNPAIVQTAGAALTTALTTVTSANTNSSPDYALQAVINSSAYGFASEAEAISFIYVVINLQTRVNELEARLQAAGIIA